MKVLITGSSGLIGSEAVREFCQDGHEVHGLDNNMREFFFGVDGDTEWMRKSLQNDFESFVHHSVDIQDRPKVESLLEQLRPEVVIHCAAQPSHDLAARIPHLDFSVNAVGTLNLLEGIRKWCPESTIIHMSTNKVYGDRPNGLKLVETEKRIDFADPNFAKGINEELSVDQSTHSVFGCSKLAADILAQEYGRNFGLRVGVFRGGCLTGPNHSGVKLHGFLSYIVKCAVSNEPYTIFGYGGKQVRDQIHSKDVVSAFKMFVSRPKCGAVYNLGGGRENSASIIEIIELLESITEKKMRYEYDESNRVGDHKCYYSDLTKFERDFPEWELRYSLSEIVEEMVRRSFMDITGSK